MVLDSLHTDRNLSLHVLPLFVLAYFVGELVVHVVEVNVNGALTYICEPG